MGLRFLNVGHPVGIILIVKLSILATIRFMAFYWQIPLGIKLGTSVAKNVEKLEEWRFLIVVVLA